MGLYTVGYGGWDCEKLIATLLGLGTGVKVYDVRLCPASRRPEFSRKRLSARLGQHYVHAIGFGNLNYKSGGIRLADPEPWYAKIHTDLESGQPAVLLCICARLDICHRLVIAQELERRLGIKAQHMALSKEKPRKDPDGGMRSLFEKV